MQKTWAIDEIAYSVRFVQGGVVGDGGLLKSTGIFFRYR
jgi:hypothetical protein